MSGRIVNTQLKIVFMLVVAFSTIILLFSVWVYMSIPRFLHDYYYDVLEIRGVAAAKVELDGVPGTMDELRTVFSEKLLHERDDFFRLHPSIDFRRVADSLDIPLVFFDTAIGTGSARYQKGNRFYSGLIYQGKAGKYLVVSSAQDNFEERFTHYLQKTLTAAILIAFCVSLFLAVYFSRYIFMPISRITKRVKQISSENLHLRLDQNETNDELNKLVQTFNDMLDRLGTAFETQNNFISNASHELRTPLTSIIGEGDVALSRDRNAAEYRESIRIMLAEAEKLHEKTNALLLLAQTGFNGKIQQFDKLRVDQLLWDVKHTVEKLNPSGKIHIDMSLLPEDPTKLKVKANEPLLHLALTNIISNACKYSDNQLVHVSLGASNNHVVIVIRDKGIGIPSRELKYIYDPFFRASNTSRYEGYGVGLPLTRNIIKIHQGRLHVSSLEANGTTVQILLPIGNYGIG